MSGAPWLDEDGEESWSAPWTPEPEYDPSVEGPEARMYRTRAAVVRAEDCPCCHGRGWVSVAYP